MTVFAIQAPAGVGKTTLVIDKIRDSRHKRVEIYVPTLKLAEEVEAKLKQTGVSTLVIRGRDQLDENGHTLCLKAPLANAIAKKGYPVFPVICMGQSRPGDKSSFRVCEHFARCKYLTQFESDVRVRIYTHAYLPLPRNIREERRRPTLVIIDESFLSVCLRVYEFSRNELQAEAKGVPAVKKVVALLLQAIDKGGPLLDQLRKAGLTADMLKAALEHTKSSGASFNPYSTDEQLLKELGNVGHRARLDILITILLAELPTGRSESHGITYVPGEATVRLHYRQPIDRFKKDTRRRKTDFILIDANADAELLRQWFPDLVLMEIPVERNAYVIQCSSIRGSTSSFVEEKNQDEYSRERARANIQAVNAIITHESKEYAGKLLIVGPQSVVGNPSKDIQPRIIVPPNASTAHFNGLRGVDIYKDYEGVIIIGRNQPPIEELEALARALWYDSPTPLRFAIDWVVEERPYWMRNPQDEVGIEVLVHPDPRIQKLHEQIREGESTQAIDRLRLVHTLQPKRVIVLSNLPLRLQVDELRTFKQLANEGRLDQAFEELDGVMPLNPAWLAGRFPSLWATSGAAKMEIRAGGKKGQIVNNISINNSTLLNGQYRVVGQRRHSRVVSRHSADETVTKLCRTLRVAFEFRPMIDGKPGATISPIFGYPSFEPWTASGSMT